MKTLILTILSLVSGISLYAQNFNKNLATARTAYSAGKLEDSRFAMQQMLQELDLMAGKEVLKILPEKMETLSVNTANDNVSGAAGFAGAVIHRDYGSADKTVSIEIISNSPLISSINAILAIPFIGRGGNGNQKIIKIEGYKALVQKNDTDSKLSYDVQVPMGSTLLTLKAEGFNEDAVVKFASALPMSDIAKKLQ
ncbi:hypothetical protein [Rubrolithibacter danxiaensis]|uniref:hypothetical protein n=1 Tax=Rubrolithibacter danxiaensis TaxID=3390805 RepID=UPI003BF92236